MSDWENVVIPRGWELEVLEEMDSSSDELWRRAEFGSVVGCVLVVERQTKGRGRRGSVWFAGEGSLALSLGLPSLGRQPWKGLTAGVLVARSLERLGFFPQLKWPNDVWLRGKKVAGLLLETRGEQSVLGIGLNVSVREFPDGFEATSLWHERGDVSFSRADVLSVFLEEFWKSWGMSVEDTIGEFRKRCGLVGKLVKWLELGELRSGECFGVADSGALVVVGDRGREELWQVEQIRVIG